MHKTGTMNTKFADPNLLDGKATTISAVALIAVTVTLLEVQDMPQTTALTLLVAGLAMLVSFDSDRRTRLLIAFLTFGIVVVEAFLGNPHVHEYAPLFMLSFLAVGYLLTADATLFSVAVFSVLVLTISFPLLVGWTLGSIIAVNVSKSVSEWSSGVNPAYVERILNKYFLVALVILMIAATSSALSHEEIVILPGENYYHTELDSVV